MLPKKIAQKIFSFVLFFLLFSLASCGTLYSSQQADPYRSGTQGVEVSFLTNDFTFYDLQYLRLELKLQNKGAYDFPKGTLILSGSDPTIIKISSAPLDFP